MGQELQLGEFEVEVTAYDYSGNFDTAFIPITIVDFQMPLCEGWNLRSTWLDLEKDKWQDIVAMDDGLDADSILRWNSAASPQQWEQYRVLNEVAGWYDGDTFVASALMEPLESYWIRAGHNDQLGLITYRGISAPPSRPLPAGWNLIGADINWEMRNMDAEDALKCIEEATDHCTGYTQVLSVDQNCMWCDKFYFCRDKPYQYPAPEGCKCKKGYQKRFWQDTWVYVAGTGGWCTKERMTRGGGYWVFMANPAVLAGFNSTPLPMNFWMHWCGGFGP